MPASAAPLRARFGLRRALTPDPSLDSAKPYRQASRIMIDLRPIGYVIGLLVTALGVTMLPSLALDLAEGRGQWPVFLQSAIFTCLAGGLVAIACRDTRAAGLSIQQAFLLTTSVWVVLPLFGGLPFMLGATEARLVDAYFEAMSALTTTGTTVFAGLDDLPKGLLLWRSLLNWLGGLGIVIVAMLFLPIMRVGGMQYFKSEGFDTLGKVLPRALDIAQGLLNVYIALTVAGVIAFLMLGMNGLDATAHAMSAVSTGGMSTRDSSLANYSPAIQYTACVLMIGGSVPFVRLIFLMRGDIGPLWRDSQVRAYLRWMAYAFVLIAVARVWQAGEVSEPLLRATLVNLVSIFSGTGFTSADVSTWGAFAFVVLLATGAIGGCTSSTGCSIKVFRYQVLIGAITAQIARVRNPSAITTARLDGQPLSDDVIGSVMVMFTTFVVGYGVVAILLSLTGLTFLEATTGAWTSIFDVGPMFGPSVGPSGSVEALPDAAKWIMAVAMVLGRLEIVSVLVLLRPVFWRG